MRVRPDRGANSGCTVLASCRQPRGTLLTLCAAPRGRAGAGCGMGRLGSSHVAARGSRGGAVSRRGRWCRGAQRTVRPCDRVQCSSSVAQHGAAPHVHCHARCCHGVRCLQRGGGPCVRLRAVARGIHVFRCGVRWVGQVLAYRVHTAAHAHDRRHAKLGARWRRHEPGVAQLCHRTCPRGRPVDAAESWQWWWHVQRGWKPAGGPSRQLLEAARAGVRARCQRW